MVYTFKAGSRIRASAQAAGEMCEELAASGALTPKRLLDANRDEDAPLHDEFEWDDGVAAEKYRENQAAHIIRCITVKVETETQTATRAFVRATEISCEYLPISVVMKDPKLTEALLREARRDMETFIEKYQALEALTLVLADMNSVLKRMEVMPYDSSDR